ncbi:MAG TPA: hypothetical protein VFU13_19830 [Steroidobacteraceae bacterium]|nr:hypothetical protein [Steroidobacteraceae bacterium]
MPRHRETDPPPNHPSRNPPDGGDQPNPKPKPGVEDEEAEEDEDDADGIGVRPGG